MIAELSKHEFKVNAHVRVVVEGHFLALFDKEHDKTVVFVSIYGDLIEVGLKVIIVGS